MKFEVYIARDKTNRDLFLYHSKPNRNEIRCEYIPSSIDVMGIRLDKNMFPEITYESGPVKFVMCKDEERDV